MLFSYLAPADYKTEVDGLPWTYKSGQERFPELFFSKKGLPWSVMSAQERFPEFFLASKSVQERSKRVPRGLPSASASGTRFGPILDPLFQHFREPRHLKNQGKALEKLWFLKNRSFQLGSLWGSIWDPPGLPFGRGFGPQDC